MENRKLAAVKVFHCQSELSHNYHAHTYACTYVVVIIWSMQHNQLSQTAIC